MKATEIIATINDNMTMTEVAAIVEQAKTAAKEETAAAKNARIKELLALVPADQRDKCALFTEYLNNPFYTGTTVSGPNKENKYTVNNTKRQLSYAELDSAYRKSDRKGTLYTSKDYAAAMTEFVKAMYAYTAARYNKDKAQATVTASLGTLQAKLQTVFNAMFPAEMKIMARRADVRAIAAACYNEKFMDFTQRNDTAVKNKITLAAGKSYRKESYDVDGSKSKALTENNTEKKEDKTAA